MAEIKICDRFIGPGHRPFIIAEMSGNHNQSLERALKIVDAAALAGAHALKLQTYTPDTMTIDKSDGEFFMADKNALWQGKSLYELYKEAMTPWDWHAPIFEHCKKRGILPFSTPFDASAVDFLESIGVAFYKIASFENTDLPLIKKVAQTGKPMIVSTGMMNLAEMGELVQTARSAGCRDLVLLKCTSSYPSTPEHSNIRTIPHMRELFNCEVGLSDHTFGVGAAVAAVALGATVIEKHFTLARADGGVDSTFSLEPDEMKSLVIETERAWQALGEISYEPQENEKWGMRFRRSLYVVKDMQEGEVFTPDNVRAIRPGLGLPTKFIDIIMGKKAVAPILRGTAMKWNLIK